MKSVIQRVRSASVSIDGKEISRIDVGLLVLLGVVEDDEERDIALMVEKIPNLRIFSDEQGRMNLSLLDVHGAILLVSQFTLMAEVSKGRRPSFVTSAAPEKANAYYAQLAALYQEQGIHVETGRFGADMQVALINDGPVTILLDSRQR